jgi:thiol-disulfide isomerase/thioredoxin
LDKIIETLSVGNIGGKMKFHKLLLFTMIALALVVSACTPTQTPTSMANEPSGAMPHPTEDMSMSATATAEAMMGNHADEMMATPTDDMMMHGTATLEAMMGESTPEMLATPTADMMMHDTATPQAMMEPPAWFQVSLTNVHDGSAFTINDFAGKVVLVETMAVWCPTCKRQQEQITSLHSEMGMNSDVVTISLDIDPNENAAMLQTYAADNGFDWIYAVAPKDVARDIGNLYGAQFLNPPSTPMLIIDRHGEAHPLPFGVKSADDLMKAIESYLDGM